MRTIRLAVGGLAAATLALTACSSGTEPQETSTPTETAQAESEAPETMPAETEDTASGLLATVADTLYGPIEIPQPDDGELTVVALGWSDAEVALALGVTPVAVSDWLGFGVDASGVGPWAQNALAGATPAVFESPFGGYDYEAIQALDPDLILNTRAGADEEQFNRLSSIAPTVYAPSGTADFGTAWDVQIAQVAEALGVPADGEALVADLEQTITDAADAHPRFNGVSAVTGTKFGDQYGAYIAGDFRWDLMESLGFVQNEPVLALEPSGFYVPLSAEQIGALDAEVAVFFPIGFTLEEMKADPLVGSLAVVQENRTVWLETGADLTQAFSAASPLSIPIVVDGLTQELAAIVG